jgi:hypothetical protein
MLHNIVQRVRGTGREWKMRGKKNWINVQLHQWLPAESQQETDRQTELIWHSMRANTKLPNLHVARTVTWRLRVECVTNWTDQSPWEANRNSMKKPPPSPLCSSKIHHRVHNSPPLISILSHMEPIHTLSPTPSRSILTPSPTHAQTLRVVSLL